MRLMNTATDTTPADRTTLSDDGVGPSLGIPVGGMAAPRPTSRSVLFKEMRNRQNTVVKIGDLEFLVRRVQPVVRKTPSHHHRRDSEVVGEIANDGHRTAA